MHVLNDDDDEAPPNSNQWEEHRQNNHIRGIFGEKTLILAKNVLTQVPNAHSKKLIVKLSFSGPFKADD